jgi:hypothetical protein
MHNLPFSFDSDLASYRILGVTYLPSPITYPSISFCLLEF